jgi:hypothetical protein
VDALQLTLTIKQGTTWAHGFGLTLNGQPLVGDWTVQSQVRPAPSSATVLHEWSTALSNAAVTDGAVTLTVEPAESSAWAWRSGYFDVEVTSPDGADRYEVARGSITVVPEVTR